MTGAVTRLTTRRSQQTLRLVVTTSQAVRASLACRRVAAGRLWLSFGPLARQRSLVRWQFPFLDTASWFATRRSTNDSQAACLHTLAYVRTRHSVLTGRLPELAS